MSWLAVPGCLLVIAAAAVAHAASALSESERNGEALLARQCARCHAIGRTDTGQHPEAPAFRTLGRRYPIESLEEALGEGILTGHPDMPEFEFTADEVGDIVAYLNAIQER
jgi:mono/diheme cytochrome c family protein